MNLHHQQDDTGGILRAILCLLAIILFTIACAILGLLLL